MLTLNLISAVAFHVQSASAETLNDPAKPPKSTEFAFNLFRREASNTARNTLISPFSIYMALGMTANGAAGATRSQMAQLLGVSGSDFSGFNASNHKILLDLTENPDAPHDFASTLNAFWKSITNSNDVNLEIANALYADNAFPLKRPFIDLCQKEYMSESHNEKFSDPSTVNKINNWCDQKTHGKIKQIVSQLRPETSLLLLNSIYFKGCWRDAFKPWDTRQEDFKLLDGSIKKVPMMHKTGDIEYLQGDGFEALTLPYLGRRYQVMYVFLPAPGASFTKFLASFTAKNWKSMRNKIVVNEVILSMPKFKIECASEFKNSLSEMGMSDAFGVSANFDGLCAVPTQISQVIQKTYVEVDEAGTKAAVVTAVPSEYIMAPAAKKPVQFTVDRPFIILIADRNTDEVLFFGSIVDPTLK